MSEIVEALCACSEAFHSADLSLPIIQISRTEMRRLKAEVRHAGIASIEWNGNDYDVFVAGIKIEERE